MSDRTIIADHLVKRFRDQTAVNDVSFTIQAGEVFGFLGPNGAGKSTTISMLTTLTMPTAGQASVGGYDIVHQADAVRRSAGVALQEIGLDPQMTGPELLIVQGRLFGFTPRQARERTQALLQLVGLEDVQKRPVGKFSGGMRRRLDLALALVHEPDILFLDEPTTGLDPASRRDVWREIRRLNRERGMTIFLTSQYLEEVDELADRIAIIDQGKIAIEGTPAALKASVGSESIALTFATDEQAQHAETALADMGQRMQRDQHIVRLYLAQAAQAVPTVISRLTTEGVPPLALTLAQPTLDDVFLQVTGKGFAAEPDRSPQAKEVR